MRFKQLTNFIFNAWKAGEVKTAFCLLGPPGIGKSQSAVFIADKMSDYIMGSAPTMGAALCTVVDLSSRLPEDISGLPYRDRVGNIDTTFYAPQSWLSQLCQEQAYGVLLLDDLPAAAPAVQVAIRQLVLDRRVGEHRLSEGIQVIVTGNRREDKSAASTLPAHFRNSVCLLEVETDVEEWCAWYGLQEKHEPIVASFFRFKPGYLSQLPKDADQRGAFCTPRSAAKLGRLYNIAAKDGCLIDVASGLIGQGVATEFVAFVNVRAQLVNPDEVLRDPLRAIKDPKRELAAADRMFSMCSGLGEVAAAWRTGTDSKLKKEAALALMRAVGHVTQGSREYISTAVSTYTSNGGVINELSGAARTNMNDPLVKSVIDFLNKTFQQG